ncbi:MAG: arginine--tRNA ligase [DPANN group archaeon]|nr:arginine--tRNA ligase [DPANN group archaeon]
MTMKARTALMQALAQVRIKNQPLSEICTTNKIDLEEIVASPPPSIAADLCLPCFVLSKAVGESPENISAEIARTVALPPEFSEAVPFNAFVNFTFSNEYMAQMLKDILETGPAYVNLPKSGKKVLIEHTGVNPGKPWHMGHARNSVLGDVYARCARAAGLDVEVLNYIDDLGRQVATVYWGITHLKSLPENAPKLDFWQGLVYSTSAQLEKKEVDAREKGNETTLAEIAAQTKNLQNNIKHQIEQTLHQMEAGNNETAIAAKRFADESVRAQLQTAGRMNILYDLLVWESDIVGVKLFDETLAKLQKTGRVYKLTEGEDAGCIVMDMSTAGPEFADQKKSYKILVRSDSTAVYTGKDIAFQMWKFGLTSINFKYEPYLTQPNGQVLWTTRVGKGTDMPFASANNVINVIGQEQKWPQKVVKESLRILGYPEQANNSYHLSYEHAVLPEGRFSGRSGNWVGSHVDAVLDHIVHAASEEFKKRFAERDIAVTEGELNEYAEKLAIGATRFFLINSDRNKKIVYDLKRMLNFAAESAPYCLYTYVRASNILKKAGETPTTVKSDMSQLTPHDKRLASMIINLPATIHAISQTYNVSALPQYTLRLCAAFNEFYEKCPVMTADPAQKQMRLELVRATQIALESCFNLIGIQKLEKM